jgi:hypothetical protein
MQPDAQPKQEVLDAYKGAQAIVDRVLALWQSKDLVMIAVYGEPNAGKTWLADEVMRRIRKVPGREHTYGGEMKGYDEPAYNIGTHGQEVYLIQILGGAVGQEDEQTVLRQDAQKAGLPEPDFTVAILNPMIYFGQKPERSLGKADVVINNANPRRK